MPPPPFVRSLQPMCRKVQKETQPCKRQSGHQGGYLVNLLGALRDLV